jgi:hypothetical protein
VLEPVVARYRGKFKRRYFRADVALANPEVYEFLETEHYEYAAEKHEYSRQYGSHLGNPDLS